MIATSNVDIRFRLGLSLAYLAATGLDASVLILGARAAVAKIANATTGSLTIAAVTAVAISVPGVIACDSVRLNGEPTDATAASFETASEYVVVTDVRISP